MPTPTYLARRSHLETYFDRTAFEAWAKLTSEAPVGSIRATVREGRDRMRGLLLNRLPLDMTGLRLLDAGCGTGALSVEAAKRGAHVTAVDLSPTLIGLARERLPDQVKDRIEFYAGDMLDAEFGDFDVCVAMDSLIHYPTADLVTMLAGLAAKTRMKLLFTFAPKTVALSAMHAIGKLFPRQNRSPAIEPVSESALKRKIMADPRFKGWHLGHGERIVNGFYTSHALELIAS